MIKVIYQLIKILKSLWIVYTPSDSNAYDTGLCNGITGCLNDYIEDVSFL